MSPRSARKWLACTTVVTAVCALILITHLTAASQRGGLAPPAPAPIATPPTLPEQPLIRGIYSWGDDVAVVT